MMKFNFLRAILACALISVGAAIPATPATSWLITGPVNSSCPATDSNIANVVLLLHMDGAGGSSTIIDNSPSAHTMATFGSATLTTTTKKFGTASLQTSNSIQGVSTGDSADWTFGSGQFTIESWVYLPSSPGALRGIVTQWGASGNFSWFLGWDASNHLIFQYTTNGSTTLSLTTTYTATLNAFHYLSVERDASNLLSLWADGVQLNSATVSSSFFDGTQALNVANYHNGSDFGSTQAFFDDIRVTKGVARDVSVVPTCAFPNS